MGIIEAALLGPDTDKIGLPHIVTHATYGNRRWFLRVWHRCIHRLKINSIKYREPSKCDYLQEYSNSCLIRLPFLNLISESIQFKRLKGTCLIVEF